MTVSIDSIEKRGSTTYVRLGHQEIEIPGGDEAAATWAAENAAHVDVPAVIGLAMRDHLKTDPKLLDTKGLVKRDLTATEASPKAVKNG